MIRGFASVFFLFEKMELFGCSLVERCQHSVELLDAHIELEIEVEKKKDSKEEHAIHTAADTDDTSDIFRYGRVDKENDAADKNSRPEEKCLEIYRPFRFEAHQSGETDNERDDDEYLDGVHEKYFLRIILMPIRMKLPVR
jgi:hypothetical protein